MNPFQRLRQTIDKLNLVYQFEQNEQDERGEPQRDVPVSQPAKQTQVINDPNELNRIKQLYSNNQIVQMNQIHALTSKIQQITKSLKRAEATIEAQINDIVSLQKENELLKDNLNEQYKNIVAHDDRERKLKEEIYRINITVNQLATEINSERNSKKQLFKQFQKATSDFKNKNEELKYMIQKVEGERESVKSELDERIQMFQYNVKKNGEDRKQYKNQLARLQDNYEKTLNEYRIDIDKLRQDLFQTKKQVQILTLRKENVEKDIERISINLLQLKQKNKDLEEQLRIMTRKYQEIVKDKDHLSQQNSSLGSQLQEQRKNIKIKVVQVRDQTALMELQMYKRQCRQLMQQKAIVSSLNRTERSIEPSYRIIGNEPNSK